MKINLQKYIASTGYCARRKAGELIKQGKVKINGKVVGLGIKVDDGDKVEVCRTRIGKTPLSPPLVRGEANARYSVGGGAEKIYIKLNKPVGYTCTNRKFKGEKNVFELMGKPHPNPPLPPIRRTGDGEGTRPPPLRRGEGGRFFNKRLFVVGRLDKNSRGLVLLTNDGDWAFKMTHPKFGHEKRYEVEVKKAPQSSGNTAGKVARDGSRGSTKLTNAEVREIIKEFKKGVVIIQRPPLVPPCKGGKRKMNTPPYPPLIKGGSESFKVGKVGMEIAKAKEVKYLGDNKFSITLTTGKKRQIRRMFSELGYEVTDLLRTGIGDIELGNLGEGESRGFSI